MAAPGRTLGIDLGDVRIGLALSDLLGVTAQPAGVLVRKNAKADLAALVQLVETHDAVRVVIGLPLLLSGEAGTRARDAEAFATALRAMLPGVAVDLWDERLTTKEAERTLIAADVSRKARRRVVDSLAAVLILQNYMDRHASPPAP
jgi:putative Holliday junction resolvase